MITRHKLRTWKTVLLGVAALVACMTVMTGPAVAQTNQPGDVPAAGRSGMMSAWDLLLSSGVIGLILLLASVAATALIVEHFVTIRMARLVPKDLTGQLERLLNDNNIKEARHTASASPTFLGQVMAAGLGQVGGVFGWFDIQTAMQEAAESRVSALYRKLEYLTFIAAAAPMLGLLGTVTGMISSFNVIAGSEGTAPPSQLAGGISQALVTTCIGLSVAIPTMFFVGFFRNRIDSMVNEAGAVTEKLMSRFRHGEDIAATS